MSGCVSQGSVVPLNSSSRKEKSTLTPGVEVAVSLLDLLPWADPRNREFPSLEGHWKQFFQIRVPGATQTAPSRDCQWAK